MTYEQLTETCFAAAIGEEGLSDDEFAPYLEACRPGLDELRRLRADSGLPLLALPYARDDLEMLAPVVETTRRDFRHVVVLATGGSSLGGQALVALARKDGDEDREQHAGTPRLHFADNLDPLSLAALLDSLDLAETAFLAISKSGATIETLAQTLVCLDAVHGRLGEDACAGHFIAVSEPGENPLRRLAERFKIQVLDHDPGIGGRFSVLSLVGLLPALLAGLDASAVREGAAQVLDASLGAEAPSQSAPAVGAALAVALHRHRGLGTSVLMPYSDRLGPFALWYRQLWAESLGKKGEGTTPVPALGPVDQHSQLQLYLDGPADKMFTLILPDVAGRGPRVDGALADDPELQKIIGGRTIGDIVDAEQRATAETLARRGRPIRVFKLGAVDEKCLGALFMHFMLETILAARLLGVDPFDQPAVEEGKALARRYLEETP